MKFGALAVKVIWAVCIITLLKLKAVPTLYDSPSTAVCRSSPAALNFMVLSDAVAVLAEREPGPPKMKYT